MFVSKYLPILGLLGVTFALPHASNSAFEDYFVHPNKRNNGFLHGRIIGGTEATPHAYPYEVGFYANNLSGTSFCGGSLVSKNYVLTAAHCVDSALSVDLIFGAQNIDDDQEASQVRIHSEDVVIHKEWNTYHLVNDIALIKLPQPIEETDDIKIVKIANGDSSYAGESALTAGWGVTSNDQSQVTPTLRYVVSTILSNDDCKNIDPFATIIQPTHICLSGSSTTGNVGTCNGDSGGPLVSDGVQIGLVSFGYKDCELGKPSVFTRLTEFKDWIREHSDVDI